MSARSSKPPATMRPVADHDALVRVGDAQQRRDARRARARGRPARGRPACSTCPSSSTITSSASSAASSGSCVTITAAQPRLALQPAKLPAQRVAHGRVETGEGLIEQQHARLDRERTRDRHPALLAAGELLGVATLEPRKAQPLDPPRGQRARRRARRRSPAATRPARQQRGALRHVAEAAPLRRAVPPARARRARTCPPVLGRAEPREQAQRERLAGAGGAQQREPSASRACVS